MNRVGIIGAGLAGAMAALYLARDGYSVDVFDGRPDPRSEDISETSMNLGLSRRGLNALGAVGLLEDVLPVTIPMSGRVIHTRDGRSIHQPYGRRRGEVIHAIRRGEINAILVRSAAAHPRVRFHFRARCSAIDRDTATIQTRDPEGRTAEHRFDFLVGADGVASTVRAGLQRGQRANFSQEYLPWGWKELTIPADAQGRHRLEKNAFHLWPRGGCMLFAHPNQDGTFTGSLVLPWSGPQSFETLASPDELAAFFTVTFPDLPELLLDLERQFHDRPIIPLATIRTSPWSYLDRAVLLGDSAHAVVPFYAQGMNAAFEDCATLAECLRHNPRDRARAFAEFERLRRPNTDALADLSKENFAELRAGVNSLGVRAHRRLNLILHHLLGARWMPLHARVTNTSVSYARARELDHRQNQILAGAAAVLGGAAVWSLLHLLLGKGG